MNINNFLLPLICAVVLLTVSSTFSDVYARTSDEHSKAGGVFLRSRDIYSLANLITCFR